MIPLTNLVIPSIRVPCIDLTDGSIGASIANGFLELSNHVELVNWFRYFKETAGGNKRDPSSGGRVRDLRDTQKHLPSRDLILHRTLPLNSQTEDLFGLTPGVYLLNVTGANDVNHFFAANLSLSCIPDLSVSLNFPLTAYVPASYDLRISLGSRVPKASADRRALLQTDSPSS